MLVFPLYQQETGSHSLCDVPNGVQLTDWSLDSLTPDILSTVLHDVQTPQHVGAEATRAGGLVRKCK